MSYVGTRVPPIDWDSKTSGTARFTLDDVPDGALSAAVLRSPHPHALIRSCDVSAARSMPGVRAVITAEDFAPDARYFGDLPFGDRHPLARDKVRFIGEEVVAVAAETPEIARDALRAVQVRYKRLRAPLFPEHAMRRRAKRLHRRSTGEANVSVRQRGGHGDMAAVIAASAGSARGRFSYPRVAQAPMEPSACIASWDEASQRLELWTTTQVPLIVTEVVADMLDLERDQVACREVAVGGAFGARSRICEYEVLTAMLSRKAGRPVAMAFSRDEEFSVTRTRHAFDTDLTGYTDADGHILGFDVRLVMSNGAYNMTGPMVLSVALHGLGGLYRPRAVRWDARVVDTALVPGGQMRGLGYPQVALASESIVDQLAERHGIDPLAYRIRNANVAGEHTLGGGKIGSADLARCLERAGEEIGWEAKRASDVAYRGVGVAAGMHGSGDNGGRADANRSDAAIDLFADGRARVRYGSIDFGTHQRTVIAQIAADELGIAFDEVEVQQADTDTTPFELGQWGSRGTYFAGHAVRTTARELAERLRDLARKELETEEVALVGGVASSRHRSVRIGDLVDLAPDSSDGRLTQHSRYVDPIINFDPENASVDDISGTYAFAAHAAEVEVDPDTGRVRILDYVAAHDVGRALNPAACEGQIIGGTVMGLGAVLGEELVHQDGRPVNPAYLNYAMPRAADVPRVRPFLVEGAVDNGPYGAKSVGELPTVLAAPAVLNAVYDAIGIRFHELPLSPDKVLGALREQRGVRRRRHRLWRRPGRWEIELVRRAYPLGMHALMNRLGRKVAGRSNPRALLSVTSPTAIDELVGSLGDASAVLGGGTDLQLQRRQGLADPEHLVSVRDVRELGRIFEAADGSLVIGAGVTLDHLVHESTVPALLVEAVGTIASHQIRVVATVGGNLVQAKRCWFFRNGFDCYKRAGATAPCYAVTGDHRFYHAAMGAHRCQAVTPSDVATALVALDGEVVIAGPDGERTVPVAGFYRGPGETVLRSREVVRSVRVPASARGRSAAFEKLGLWTGDFAVASVAVSCGTGANGRGRDARVVLGALAPTPWRAQRAEAMLETGAPVDRVLDVLDGEFDRHAHPLQHNGWKLDAALGLARKAMIRLERA